MILLPTILINMGKKRFLNFLTSKKNKNTFKLNSKAIKNILGSTGCAETKKEKSGKLKARMYAFCLLVCTKARINIKRMGSMK